ncbi:MAG: Y-family DNA polymerase [Bacteroidota bacterium]
MYALVDCNNFYVSCERVFNPGLLGKPVIVLSNNDGCAISRSDEAKAAGIPMGAAAHLVADLIEKHQVQLFSSNYTLYGDMSDRVMKTLTDFVPGMEIYSIDEAFLDMADLAYTDLHQLGMTIRATVFKNTGIPICVGIAPTKALAKMANRYAKKKFKSLGVYYAANDRLVDEMLEFTKVGDVWGIGRQYCLMLNKNGVKTAKEFVELPEDFVRAKMSVMGLRLQQELRGIPSIDWEFDPAPKKNICVGRSFGTLIRDKEKIREALSNFAANVAAKAREQNSVAGEIRVFINTNPHRMQDPQYFRSIVVQMDPATNNPARIIKYALKALDIIFKQGYSYMKCGVELHKLVTEDAAQMSLFDAGDSPNARKVIAALDKVNKSMGPGAVRLAIQGFNKGYRPRAVRLSPKFTTLVSDIIKVS